MAKNHGARQQKKLAKQKAKRSEKRTYLSERTSTDPTIRFREAKRWPVVEALIPEQLWEDGIGQLILARREAEGQLIYGVYLVDVFCLGVKDAFWQAGSPGQFKELVEKINENSGQKLKPATPAALVKIIQGAVEFAKSFGFAPHSDYRHTAMLLSGIDPAACLEEYAFGKNGKPVYFQGPYESVAQATAIRQRIIAAGGDYTVMAPDLNTLLWSGFDDDPDFESLDEEGYVLEPEDDDEDKASSQLSLE